LHGNSVSRSGESLLQMVHIYAGANDATLLARLMSSGISSANLTLLPALNSFGEDPGEAF
jgi:hypothetical protein